MTRSPQDSQEVKNSRRQFLRWASVAGGVSLAGCNKQPGSIEDVPEIKDVTIIPHKDGDVTYEVLTAAGIRDVELAGEITPLDLFEFPELDQTPTANELETADAENGSKTSVRTSAPLTVEDSPLPVENAKRYEHQKIRVRDEVDLAPEGGLFTIDLSDTSANEQSQSNNSNSSPGSDNNTRSQYYPITFNPASNFDAEYTPSSENPFDEAWKTSYSVDEYPSDSLPSTSERSLDSFVHHEFFLLETIQASLDAKYRLMRVLKQIIENQQEATANFWNATTELVEETLWAIGAVLGVPKLELPADREEAISRLTDIADVLAGGERLVNNVPGYASGPVPRTALVGVNLFFTYKALKGKGRELEDRAFDAINAGVTDIDGLEESDKDGKYSQATVDTLEELATLERDLVLPAIAFADFDAGSQSLELLRHYDKLLDAQRALIHDIFEKFFEEDNGRIMYRLAFSRDNLYTDDNGSKRSSLHLVGKRVDRSQLPPSYTDQKDNGLTEQAPAINSDSGDVYYQNPLSRETEDELYEMSSEGGREPTSLAYQAWDRTDDIEASENHAETLVGIADLLDRYMLKVAFQQSVLQSATALYNPSEWDVSQQSRSAGGPCEFTNDAAWRELGRTATNVSTKAGATGPSGDDQPTSQWKLNAGDAAATGPVVSDGTLYVTVGNAVGAVDPCTGDLLWEQVLDANTRATPLIMDGRVYIGDNDGTFYALSAETGERVRSVDLGRLLLSATTDSESIYLANRHESFEETNNRVWSVTPDLEVNWAMGTDSFFKSYGTPAVADGICVAAGDSDILAYDTAAGEQIWTADRAFAYHTVSIYDGQVYTAAMNDKTFAKKLAVHDLNTGETLRSAESPSFSSFPVFADERLYLGGKPSPGTGPGGVYVYNPDTLERVDKYEVSGESQTPVVTDDCVYAWGGETLTAFSKGGDRLWSIQTDGEINSQPLALDGQLFLATESGAIEAYR